LAQYKVFVSYTKTNDEKPHFAQKRKEWFLSQHHTALVCDTPTANGNDFPPAVTMQQSVADNT